MLSFIIAYFIFYEVRAAFIAAIITFVAVGTIGVYCKESFIKGLRQPLSVFLVSKLATLCIDSACHHCTLIIHLSPFHSHNKRQFNPHGFKYQRLLTCYVQQTL
ncbi:hypothetical protein GBAR_LOCUS14554 [Geodia barretti]|uniref:Uncharacterized protein n=1 Tax=Geodia barretti TaxID=519541 RepID=A0AA35SAJ5_GEOBA|nr:hypothetical protein GBAR_LOCUS14554 [Geodia barretti]